MSTSDKLLRAFDVFRPHIHGHTTHMNLFLEAVEEVKKMEEKETAKHKLCNDPWTACDECLNNYEKWKEINNETNKVSFAQIDLENNCEPPIILSAFLLKNGKRIMIYTGNSGIVSYECFENWEKHPEPFAQCPKELMSESPTQFHINIRKIHGEESFIKKRSTDITWKI